MLKRHATDPPRKTEKKVKEDTAVTYTNDKNEIYHESGDRNRVYARLPSTKKDRISWYHIAFVLPNSISDAGSPVGMVTVVTSSTSKECMRHLDTMTRSSA